MSSLVDTMSDYRNYVQRCASTPDGTIILNRTPAHASVILSTIFSVAKKMAEAISGHLEDSVWGHPDVIDSVVAFLSTQEAARLRVIVERKIDLRSNKLISAIVKSELQGKVKVFVSSPDDLARQKFHFLVVDGIHYRFQGNRENHEALIQFGEQRTSEQLRRIFADVRSRATPLAFQDAGSARA